MEKSALPLSILLLAACSDSQAQTPHILDVGSALQADAKASERKKAPEDWCLSVPDHWYDKKGFAVVLDNMYDKRRFGTYTVKLKQFGEGGPMVTVSLIPGNSGPEVYGIQVKKGDCSDGKKKKKCEQQNSLRPWKWGSIIENRRDYPEYLEFKANERDARRAIKKFYHCLNGQYKR